MRFSLDFDGTYTADPEMWKQWIALVTSLGHEVFCITYRPSHRMQKVHDSIGQVIGIDKCVSTGGTAKKKHVEKIGLKIDVWIDDTPEMLITPTQLNKWRTTPFN